MPAPLIAACTCGKCSAEVTHAPSRRIYCHCSVCQRIYGKPFADVTILPASAVTVPKDSPLTFRRYKAPPAINRGTCPDCNQPVVGFMTYAPGLRVAYIPASAFKSDPPAVAPSAHLFYKTRTKDAEDALPKYSGTIASFIAGTPTVLLARFGR